MAMNISRFSIPSIILAIGFIAASYILGAKWVESRASIRYVTVKGLSERNVSADKAWWSINSQIGGNTTDDIQRNLRWVEKEIKSFYYKQGFLKDEISIESVNVYANNYNDVGSKYNADLKISVTTNDVEKVIESSKLVMELIGKGILIQSDKWASGPKYYYTKFRELKTEMLAEAASEAKKAAREFAENSGSKVGQIRRANQGVFQILPGNQTNEDQTFFPDKIIRVVSTVDFFLE